MKTYKVDLDYESYLFDPNYKEDSASSLKINREFEYVYFLVQKEKSCLKNCKKYTEKYLELLSQFSFLIPSFSPKASCFEYWWGHRHGIELEKQLNSKLTSSKIAKDNNWGFYNGAIITNLSELETHLGNHQKINRWILKSPDGFSGIGHYQFEASKLDKNILLTKINKAMLLEPVYQRVFDIGTTFEIENGKILRKFMVENHNSSFGTFRGGVGSSSVDKFKKYIYRKYNYSLDRLDEYTDQIAACYLSLGAISNIQIDSFIYLENNELKLYALVEVNYRKTMGLVIQNLADRFDKYDFIDWKIVNTKEKIEQSHILHDGWIQLSPEDNKLHSYFKPMNFS